VRPVKGQIVELRSRDGAAPCERIVASERVYLVPRPDGRLIVGATSEERGFDTAVTAGGVHELLREAYRLLPDVAEMELVDSMAGLRPGTPDNLPLIGPGAIEGLVLATGHYRNGILLAPLTADAIAALLAGEQLPEAVAPAHPARSSFLAQGANKDERAPELAARGAALAEAAEAAERAAEER
jgi:glycine oxidase